MHATRLFTVLLASFLFSATALAQVFDPGPSDPALFTNVIDLPGDVLPDSNIVGDAIGETTQVNVADGGIVGFLQAFGGSEVNISGGSVGDYFNARDAEINISGGEVARYFAAEDGSVINLSGGSVGYNFNARNGSVVNISGGYLARFGNADSGSEVNISGGFVEGSFIANSGSAVNISGGSVGSRFQAKSGSAVSISGGSVGSVFRAFDFSDVELVGGEFKLNGEAFTGPTITLENNDVFSGTLADGSAFIFSADGGNDIFNGVSLTSPSAPLPEASPIPIVVATPVGNSGPQGLRAGQSLTLQTGGELGINFAVIDATLNVEGGAVGDSLEVAGGIVNMSSGSVGSSFSAFDGSAVNISGGSVGGFFRAFFGSAINISGGSIEDGLAVFSGSAATISGGSVAGRFGAREGSSVELVGGEFKLNGEAFTDPIITLGDNDVFTGTLTDGSAFIFNEMGYDELNGVNLTPSSEPLPEASPIPIVVATPVGSSGPHSLRKGQSMTLQDGGEIGNLVVVEATLNVEGGEVVGNLELSESIMNISGGELPGFRAFNGSAVNISGGEVSGISASGGSEVTFSGGSVRTTLTASGGSVVNISSGSIHVEMDDCEVNISSGEVQDYSQAFGCEINISGGSVGLEFDAGGSVINISGGEVGSCCEGGREANISGGTVGDGFHGGDVINISGGEMGTFSAGGEVNISGGSVGSTSAGEHDVFNISGGSLRDEFWARDGSEVNLFGSDFVLDGVLLDDLTAGEAFTIIDRDVTLSGLLSDGSAFSFELNSVRDLSQYRFEPGSTLTVTLTPQLQRGDCNLDGVVNFLDISSFITILSVGDYRFQADIDGDGAVSFLDIAPFIELLSI